MLVVDRPCHCLSYRLLGSYCRCPIVVACPAECHCNIRLCCLSHSNSPCIICGCAHRYALCVKLIDASGSASGSASGACVGGVHQGCASGTYQAVDSFVQLGFFLARTRPSRGICPVDRWGPDRSCSNWRGSGSSLSRPPMRVVGMHGCILLRGLTGLSGPPCFSCRSCSLIQHWLSETA